MPVTTYSGNKLLDLLLRGVTYTPPTQVYIALHTADGGLTGAGEVKVAAWPSYKRMHASLGEPIANGFTVAAAKICKNEKQLLYPMQDGASTIKLTHWSMWDAATGGNCIWTGKLLYEKVLNPTDEIVIHIGELSFEFD